MAPERALPSEETRCPKPASESYVMSTTSGGLVGLSLLLLSLPFLSCERMCHGTGIIVKLGQPAPATDGYCEL